MSKLGTSVRMFGTTVVAVSVATIMVGALATPSAVLATGDASKAQCGVETEASAGFQAYLPDCRAYELVTPPYKGGGVILDDPAAISVDGTHVISGASGAFAGTGNYWYNPNRNGDGVAYEFTRSSAGWQSEVLTPPASEYPHSALMAISANDFGTTLWGAGRTDLAFHEDIYLRTGADSSDFHSIGPGTPRNERGEEVLAGDQLKVSEELSFVGASRDLSHSVFQVEGSESVALKEHEGRNDLWPGDTTKPEGRSLYEYVYAGAEDQEPVLVGVSNEGSLHGSPAVNDGAKLISNCGTELGSGSAGSAYNAVSESGEAIFFTALECGSSPNKNELYARIGGASTVDLSEPSKEDCATCNTTTELESATFQGASESGEKAFFMTEQELLPGQHGMNLYEYDFKAPEHERVTLVSACALEPAGCSEEGDVQGVVRVSENGERVYFVAKGLLAGENNEGQQPEAGADNLYVHEPDPTNPGAYTIVFVATLLKPAEEAALESEEAEELEGIEGRAKNLYTYIYSAGEAEVLREFFSGEIGFELALELLGEVEQEAMVQERTFIQRTVGTLGLSGTRQQDLRLWEPGEGREAQATPDGEFLVFSSSADMTEEDASEAPQLFEYDAGKESLTRVSIGQEGTSSGNVKTFHEAPHIPVQSVAAGVDLPTGAEMGLAVSADGSEVFFTSDTSLAPQAQAGTTNVYEYREGAVYLVSGGGDASSTNGTPTVDLFGIDPSGRDTFFLSASPLVPQFAETQVALYDAREEGGFPAPALQPGCIAEACRGPSAAGPLLQPPARPSEAGGGNLTLAPTTSTSGTKKSGSSPKARRLAKALKACKAKRNRHKRVACESLVRKRYGATHRAKNSHRAQTSEKRGEGR